MDKFYKAAIIAVAVSFVVASASIVVNDISGVVRNAKICKSLKDSEEVMRNGGKENEQV